VTIIGSASRASRTRRGSFRLEHAHNLSASAPVTPALRPERARGGRRRGARRRERRVPPRLRSRASRRMGPISRLLSRLDCTICSRRSQHTSPREAASGPTEASPQPARGRGARGARRRRRLRRPRRHYLHLKAFALERHARLDAQRHALEESMHVLRHGPDPRGHLSFAIPRSGEPPSREPPSPLALKVVVSRASSPMLSSSRSPSTSSGSASWLAAARSGLFSMGRGAPGAAPVRIT
jgi:hypothetical protein